MTLYLKGIHLTLDSWIPYIEKKEWGLWREEFNISELDGKWVGVEEVNKPKLVIGVLCLRVDLISLDRLTKDKVPPQNQLRVQRLEIS